MNSIQDSNYGLVRSYVEQKGWHYSETEEYNEKPILRIDVFNGSAANRTVVKVYHTGKILIQGKVSTIRSELNELKDRILSGGYAGQ